MAADASGNVYAVPSSGTAVVARVNADGTISATKLDLGSGLTAAFITIDTSNRVWIAGSTIAGVNNPLNTTVGALQQTLPNTTHIHGFIARLNTAGTAIEYATYLAGSEDDTPPGIAVDSTGSLIIVGTTNSTDFPLTEHRDIRPQSFSPV